MKLLIKDAVIHDNDTGSSKKGDIEVIDGVITGIGTIAESGHQSISDSNLHCSVGWFDPFVNFGEPGNEHKEDIRSGCTAAAHGGFIHVGLLPILIQ